MKKAAVITTLAGAATAGFYAFQCLKDKWSKHGVVIGIDVGGTNTDAVMLDTVRIKVISAAKAATSSDVHSGIMLAMKALLEGHEELIGRTDYVAIGTTHFVNAVVVRSEELKRVAVIRLCGPSTQGVPPFVDFPPDLRELTQGPVFMVNGGYEFNGETSVEVDEKEIEECAHAIAKSGVNDVAIVGMFSPMQPLQEQKVAEIVRKLLPEVSITQSHKVANLGLLERENASILNASLRPLARKTIEAFRLSVKALGFTCPLYLTQNDGTIIPSDLAGEYPIQTFASGPTNSMRGAAFLTGLQDAIVVDIGGTTADVGVLENGFPRPSSTAAKVGGVRTNFCIPDVLSIGLGGGSLVRGEGSEVKVGPESVGYRILEEGRVFGGPTLTATDVAVAALGKEIVEGVANLVVPDNIVQDAVCAETTTAVMDRIHEMVEDSIDMVKTKAESMPVILVGGGSVLANCHKEAGIWTRGGASFTGASCVILPENFAVANAIGAAISQISGEVDTIEVMEGADRAAVVDGLKKKAMENAVERGAVKGSVEVLSVQETPMAYTKGMKTRFRVKAVGRAVPLSMRQRKMARDKKEALAAKVEKEVKEEEEEEEKKEEEKFKLTGLPMSETFLQDRQHPALRENGEWLLTADDVDAIAVGAAVLGTGGGGSPYCGVLRLKQLLAEKKEVKIVPVEAIAADKYGVPIGLMGAPTVLVEKLVSGQETAQCLETMEKCCGVKASALVCVEIGGLNALEPLMAGATLGLPVVDADCMGRAYPKIDMLAQLFCGGKLYPAALVDSLGNKFVLMDCRNGKHLEKHMRNLTVSVGCIAALALPPVSGQTIQNDIVKFSYSRAWRIGQAILRARREKTDPVTALVDESEGALLFHGSIVDVDRTTVGGFAVGFISIKGTKSSVHEGHILKVRIQNENLEARLFNEGESEGRPLVVTPDLISLVDKETCEPFATENLIYGLRVSVCALPAAPTMCTEQALKHVSPAAFGIKDIEWSRD